MAGASTSSSGVAVVETSADTCPLDNGELKVPSVVVEGVEGLQ